MIPTAETRRPGALQSPRLPYHRSPSCAWLMRDVREANGNPAPSPRKNASVDARLSYKLSRLPVRPRHQCRTIQCELQVASIRHQSVNDDNASSRLCWMFIDQEQSSSALDPITPTSSGKNSGHFLSSLSLLFAGPSSTIQERDIPSSRRES